MKNDKTAVAADEALALALSSLDDENLPIEDRLELFRIAARLLDGCKADVVKRAAAWNGIGVCLYRAQAGSKTEEEAFSHSLNLLRRSPEHAQGELAASVMSNLAECLLRAGKRERAYELYTQTLDVLRPHMKGSDDAVERYAMCVCAIAQCRQDKGAVRTLARQACVIKRGAGKNPRRLRALGLCRSIEGAMLCGEGRCRAGVRRLRSAVRLYTQSGAEPGDLAQIHLHLAKAAETCGNLASAADELAFSIELSLAEFPPPSDLVRIELADRAFSLAAIYEQQGMLDRSAKLYSYSANFLSCCSFDGPLAVKLTEREALSHYLGASCLVRMESPLYYDAMTHYTLALGALDRLPEEDYDSQHRMVLNARADIFEAFGEAELAEADYTA